MKVRSTHILDDPEATVETSLLIHDTQLQARVSDKELITYALEALQDSDSLERFYLSYIKDSKRNVRKILDCAAGARKELKEREQRYVEFIRNIIDAFQSGHVKLDNDIDYHWAILSLLEGDVMKLQRRRATDKHLRDKLINSYYIYWSYVFHRALTYFNNGKTKPEFNDFEDGQVCRHLALDTPYCLVTVDKGLKDALDRTIALLNRLNEPKLHTSLQVVDAKSLRRCS